MSDLELVEKYIKTKSSKIFKEIFNTHFDRIYRYIFSRVGVKEISEDITSETFLTLVKVLDHFDGKSKLSTFIFGIAINKLRQGSRIL